MQFKCELKNITIEKLAVICAIDSMYNLQSHQALITKIDKDSVHFMLKVNLSEIQQQRLFVDKVRL